MKNVYQKKILQWENNKLSDTTLGLIVEEPLSIRVNGQPYAVIMRTPGEEIPHAAGFCLSEGIIDKPDDFTTIASCEDGDTNVVTITLSEGRRKKIPGILERKRYLSQTSCGICGKEMVQDICRMVSPPSKREKIELSRVYTCLMSLPEHQILRKKTRAVHAASIHTSTYDFVTMAEDVGRHNAVDKAIGKIFLKKRMDEAFLLVLSSRISFELVQKAARAGIQVIVAYSRPTELAIQVAEKNQMTLMSRSGNDGFHIFCSPPDIF